MEFIEKIKNKIESVTGLKYEDYTSNSQEICYVYSRMIFAYHCRSMKMTLKEIGRLLKRDHATVSHYMRKYSNEKDSNRYFREMANEVEKSLKSI